MPRTEAQSGDLRELTDLCNTLSGTMDAEELLESAYRHLKKCFMIDSLSFGWLRDGENNVDWFYLLEDDTPLPAAREHVSRGLIQKAVENREVLIIDNVNDQELLTGVNDTRYDRSRSMMIAPIAARHCVTGVLTIKSYGDYSYKEADAAMLSLVSAIIGNTLYLFQSDYDNVQINDQLQALFDNLDLGVALLDDQYQLVYSNAWLTKNMALDPGNKTCFGSLFGLQQPCAGCYMEQLKSDPFPDRFVEVRIDDRLYSVHTIPLNRHDGRKLFIELIENRTEHEKTVTNLKEIKRLNSIITFARSIGHELNQPLTGISGYCALLKEEVDKGSSVYQDICEIEQQAIRLERIVNKFQSVTHLDYKEKK